MNFAAWFPIFAAVALFSVALLVHLSTHQVPYMPKWAWALLIVFMMPLGGVVYLIVVVAGAGSNAEESEGRYPQP